ncbi:MAG: methyltransferase domain-containing protein [bacterium]|nr:methyltransferase domain-containing protein [bacterium]
MRKIQIFKRHRYIFILILLFAVATARGQKIYAKDMMAEVDDLRIRRDTMCFERVGTDKLFELLAIEPGMNILDIGTGTGQFAVAFAEKMKGTGKVFATDIDIDCIDYLKKEAEKKHLTNLYPVLVKEEGIDEFYGKQRYDLITVFHVNGITDEANYFRELKKFLKENGRVIFMCAKNVPAFSLSDLTGDFNGLAREISLEPDGSPFYKSLSGPTRELIKQNQAKPDEVLKKAIVDDFNKILSDKNFSKDFLDGLVFKKELKLSPEERVYIDWLLMYTNWGEGIYYKYKDEWIKSVRNFYLGINKLLIFQRFRPYLDKDRMFQSLDGLAVKKNLEKAGYKLEKEFTDIPFEDVLVFK